MVKLCSTQTFETIFVSIHYKAIEYIKDCLSHFLQRDHSSLMLYWCLRAASLTTSTTNPGAGSLTAGIPLLTMHVPPAG